MKRNKRTVVLTISLVATLAGLGVASAQLIPSNLPAGAPAAAESQGDECASGIAIDSSLGMLCSDYCSADADCPASWGCRVIDQPNGQKQGFCFPYRAATP